LKDKNRYELLLTKEDELEGLPESIREAAALRAKEKGKTGWLFNLSAPSYVPFMRYSALRGLREKMYREYMSIGNKGDEYDNKEIIREIVNIRLEIARLMGYTNYADYKLKHTMAKTPARVYKLLNELLDAYKPVARNEYETVQRFASETEKENITVMPWDWSYYSEKLKDIRFNVNDEMTRPYFELNHVKKGVFGLATQLYGITFNYTNKDGDETETLICGNAGQLIQEPDDIPMNDNFVWIPKLPDNFPSKNMETYGYILPDETDIDWYNPDANPKEFTITTAAQLRGVSWLTNNVSNLDFKDWTLRLGANIELNNTEKWQQWNETTEGLNMWEPIGSYPNRFNGTFDGKGYTVGGIYVRDGNGAVGLFGYLGSDGTIWNVGVVKSYIHGDEEAHNGGIAGSNDGKIYSCYNTGIVDYGGVVGGIVGYNKGDIHSCYNGGTAKNGDYVGGIVGINNGKIYSCYNTGDVMDRGNTTIGGIVGELFEEGSNTNCFYLKKDDLKGVGAGLSDGTTDKTEAQFHSGEVAWELKQKPAPEGAFPWGQKLGADGNLFPVLGGEAVYKVTFEYPSAANQPATKSIFKYGNTNQLVNLTESELNQIQIPGYQLVWSEELPYNVKISDVTITADYKQLYTITIPTMTGGSVTANMDKAPAGEEITLTIFPAEGYEYVEGTLTVTNATPTEVTDNQYTFKMPAEDVTVTATFKQIEYVITIPTMPGGSVTANMDKAPAGEEITLTIFPAEGYEYVEGTLTVTNATPTEVVNNGCTFVMPASDVTVTATFQQKETPNPDPEPEPEPSYVTLHFEPNDSVCLEAESDYIEAGGTFVFTATVAEGYDPATLLVEYRKSPYLSWSPLKPAADGSYRLSWVYSDAYVRASVRPMAPTGIDVITGTQVYTESGTVVVRTAARARVTIVSLFGTTLYTREQEGTERYTDLTSGVYIVRVGDHTYKVRVR